MILDRDLVGEVSSVLVRCQGDGGALDRSQVGKSHMQERLVEFSRQPIKGNL